MERYTPIIHIVMAGSGGAMNSANIRTLGNVNFPHQSLGNVNHYVKYMSNPHHHHSGKC